jgi:hypothetical protein
MIDILSNQVRIDQTRRGLDQSSTEIEEWLKARSKKDVLKQYETQLKTLREMLLPALKELRSALDAVSPVQDVGDLYLKCREFDRRIAWVRKVWEYFRKKFDQRDDRLMGPVLAAADEIVWSCYAGSFQDQPPPAPLPYLEPRYSPEAHTRGKRPPDMESEIDAPFLQTYLAQLPIPTISLPPICAFDPWWLIYLAHEVGHHLLYDRLPDRALATTFPKLLRDAAKEARGGAAADELGEESNGRWGKWWEEIFADLFSVLAAGPWAAWAIAELELADEASMFKDRPRYPSPVVRLALLHQLAEELEVSDPTVKIRIAPAEISGKFAQSKAAEDLKQVPSIARTLLTQKLGDSGSVIELFRWNRDDFLPGGGVNQWKRDLLDESAGPEQTLAAARLIVAGGVAAWAEISTIEDGQERNRARTRLKDILLDILPKSREDKTRAGVLESTEPAQNFGQDLARLLLEADPAQI